MSYFTNTKNSNVSSNNVLPTDEVKVFCIIPTKETATQSEIIDIVSEKVVRRFAKEALNNLEHSLREEKVSKEHYVSVQNVFIKSVFSIGNNQKANTFFMLEDIIPSKYKIAYFSEKDFCKDNLINRFNAILSIDNIIEIYFFKSQNEYDQIWILLENKDYDKSIVARDIIDDYIDSTGDRFTCFILGENQLQREGMPKYDIKIERK